MLIVGLPAVLVAQAVVPRRAIEAVAAVAVAALLVLYDTALVALWGRTPGKWFAGIEVVRAERGGVFSADHQDRGGEVEAAIDAEDAEEAEEVRERTAEPVLERAAEGMAVGIPEARPESGAQAQSPALEAAGLGVARAFIRAVTFALPIALRPMHVLQLPAGLFWVANAALIFQGSERSALHDRFARTKVVIRR